MNPAEAARDLFDHSLLVGQIASYGLRIAADEARESLERQAHLAGYRCVEEYLFYPPHTWSKPHPPPTRAEVRDAFFALSGWTPGSKKTNGMIYDKSGKRASLPTKSEMEFILKKAKEQQKERMSDDEIERLVEEAKDESASESKNEELDPDMEAVRLMREYWKISRV
jgi:hypothetical protein